MPSTRRVLVTGSTGALGHRLVARLARRDDLEPVPLDRDLTDPAAVRARVAEVRPDVVVHLAAIVDLARVDGDEDRVMAVNVDGTVALGRAIAALDRPPSWVFYASSSHVYAPSDGPIDEHHPVAPRNLYGLTKAMGELALAHLAGQAGATSCTGRIFSLYDERQEGGFLLPATRRRLESLEDGASLPVRDGDSVRDFSHADELAAAIVDLLDVRAEGVVNIGSGRGRRVVDLLADVLSPHRFHTAPDGRVDAIVADTTRLDALRPEAPRG